VKRVVFEGKQVRLELERRLAEVEDAKTLAGLLLYAREVSLRGS